MGVRLDRNIVRLEGRCNVEDAEPLLGFLQADGSRIVDIAAAEHLHSAVIQVLMALRPTLSGSSPDQFLNDWIIPILQTDASTCTLVERT